MEAVFVVAVVIALAALVISWLVRRFLALVTVYEFQRGLRYDRGRFTGVIDPGQYRILRRRSTISTLDVRPRVATVPGQEVITADGVSIRISLLAEYEIVDPAIAVNRHADFGSAFYAALQTALRDIIAAKEIDDVLEQRAEIGATLTEKTQGEAERLGLSLSAVEVKDLMLPGELKRTFAQVVAARKDGLAALERARGETAALRNLANAARVMSESPALMQLRLLQELGKSTGNTVVLGFPAASTPLPLREGQPASELLEPPPEHD